MGFNKQIGGFMTKFCTPALIYLGLSLLSLFLYISKSLSQTDHPSYPKIFATIGTIGMVIIKLIIMALWTILLNFLCENNLRNVAWGILCIPLLFFAYLIFKIFVLLVYVILLGGLVSLAYFYRQDIKSFKNQLFNS